VLGKDYLVTFQERAGDCFDIIRAAIRQDASAKRHGAQPDYLAYRLIDASIDAYFPILESIGDHLDRLDDRSIAHNSRAAFAELHATKRELLMLRRAIWPLRDALNELRRESTPYVTDTARIYLRDCYDHTVQLIDLLESYRDIAGDVRDFYLSSISNRMNDVMKSLTLIATIFLPLTFIAGVYGMNFDPEAGPWNMPELRWPYGYIYSLVLMLVVGVGMYIFFRWRGYLAGDPSGFDGELEHEHERSPDHESGGSTKGPQLLNRPARPLWAKLTDASRSAECGVRSAEWEVDALSRSWRAGRGRYTLHDRIHHPAVFSRQAWQNFPASFAAQGLGRHGLDEL
jgi:magnesium/cobalt transport protein CorA